MSAEQVVSQAVQWAHALNRRSAFVASSKEADLMICQLMSDYPHRIVLLKKQGEMAGVRRVFRDRSYCDMMGADVNTCRVVCGYLSEGVIAVASNGRSIIDS